jgi:protein SCO1/2
MKRKGFWLATGIIIIPVVLFYIFNAGSQNYERLPYLGEKIPPAIANEDTVFYTVPDFNVKDQVGKEINQKHLNDHIYVANFFFASCTDVCPTMNRRLQTVYDKFKEFSEVQFVSFSVDPENDSIPVLNNYAKKFNADDKIWHFTTGSKEEIFKAGAGFLLPVSIEDKTIDHSQQFILVDKANHIRGVYDSGSDAELKRLEGDLKLLLYEYHAPGTKR